MEARIRKGPSSQKSARQKVTNLYAVQSFQQRVVIAGLLVTMHPMWPQRIRACMPCPRPKQGSKTFTNALHDAFFWSDELPVQEGSK